MPLDDSDVVSLGDPSVAELLALAGSERLPVFDGALPLKFMQSGVLAQQLPFAQAGAGAVTRTMRGKLRDAAHAFDYIPVAHHAAITAYTSTQDVTSYLQAGLNAEGLLALPGGLLNISDTLSVPSFGGLRGAGFRPLIKALPNFGDKPMIRNATTNAANNAARDQGLVLDGIRLDGNKAANTTATEFSHGVALQAVDGAYLNVWTRDTKGDGVIIYYSTAASAVGSSNICGHIRTDSAERQGVAIVCADNLLLDIYDVGTKHFSLDLETDNNLNHIKNCFFRLISIGSGSAASEVSGGAGVDGGGGSGGGTIENIHIEFHIANSLRQGVVWRDVRRLTLVGEIKSPGGYGLWGLDGGLFGSTVTFQVGIQSPIQGLRFNETVGAIYGGRIAIDGATTVGAHLAHARGGVLELDVKNSGEQGIVLADVQNMNLVNTTASLNTSHNIWLTDNSIGNRFPALKSTGAGTFGRGFQEDSGSNDNRAMNARISGNGNGDVTLAGAASLVTFEPLKGSTTWDPGSIANGASASTTLTVTGASPGDVVSGSFSQPTVGLGLFLEVSAANVVKATLINNTGSSVDLASGTLKVLVTKVF